MSISTISGWLASLGSIIAPRVCRICGQTLVEGEEVMCLRCNLDLPRTQVHHSDFNIIHQRLGHNSVVDQAAGWFYYVKGSPYAQMLVDVKYSALPALGSQLGAMCAQELAAEGFFNAIDALVPMPLHWWKRMRRGYNQAYEICDGISKVTNIQILECLAAIHGHGVMSRTHNRDARYKAIKDTLSLNVKDIDVQGKRLLLVDDIITTGASCAEAVRILRSAYPASVSVLCLGLTSLR